ncbi:hypothetical protein Bbelb_268400 [Branchiostoma belcheri]|nr:hypothetical protein Bbelb_268400 [Branchiostoma belcheri]
MTTSNLAPSRDANFKVPLPRPPYDRCDCQRNPGGVPTRLFPYGRRTAPLGGPGDGGGLTPCPGGISVAPGSSDIHGSAADSSAPRTLPNSCIFSAGQYETLKQQQQGTASGMAANGGHPDTQPGPVDVAVHSEDSKPPVPRRTPRSKRAKPVLRTMRSFDSSLPSHQTVMARINEANASLASNGVHSDSESSASPSPRGGENAPNPSGTPPPPIRPTLRSLRSFDASLLQNYQVPQDDPNLAGIKSLQSRFKSLDSPGVARRARAQLDRVRDRVGLIFTAGGTGSSPGSAESTPPASPRTPRSPRIHLRRKFHFLHSSPSANDQNSVPSSHTVMHKAKSSSSSPSGHHHANKVFKRWRSKNKLLMSPTSAAASQLWSPETSLSPTGPSPPAVATAPGGNPRGAGGLTSVGNLWVIRLLIPSLISSLREQQSVPKEWVEVAIRRPRIQPQFLIGH